MNGRTHGAAPAPHTDDVPDSGDALTIGGAAVGAVAGDDMATPDDEPQLTDFCLVPTGTASEDGPDPVDELIEGWRRERPDIDLGALSCFARMKWLTKNLATTGEQVLRRHGLNPGEFDVLAALRRSGPLCTLIPSQLSALLMMSRAGITNRLDRLEASGLVERTLDPADRRSFRIRLTDKGRAVIDAAITEHAQIINRFSAVLTAEQRASLDDMLRTLLRAFP
ncbi:MarR family transcriptional regulator [Frankia sp. CNm7]|uniref:MarR family transcriptional regulator n=2 Tax=Frankia nepalensis TaxID=1836974 RepID=A0A937RGR4_9ACTN|nr:MarR family transcriptional regulator [Frankia nepalensis]MBL7500066.1 MarR family transcriptional regulator [Frankia nepalensis]MBL7509400.1 MarR family transcriptional regulator [Frankia nepalensis]MBL7522853.1 MarR family transcriptional regulator [Frankia nepalensis]MBL7631893.1 MarR family transcriptional regulator [Frankia nepalensis]